MDSLELLNKAAETQFDYIPFSKLAPGRYQIKAFFLKPDTKFKTGARMCVNFNDRYWVMLPKRYVGTPKSIKKLNENPSDLLFEGKESKFVLNLSFATSDPEKCDEIHFIDEAEEEDQDEN